MISTSAKLLEAAVAELSELCIRVGLVRSPDLRHDELPTAARGPLALWTSDYACVMLWHANASSSGALEAELLVAEDCIETVLSSREEAAPGSVMDGYLVLALESPPDSSTQSEVRRIELSSQICRKHVIWPRLEDGGAKGSTWERIAAVTAVGLPDAPAAPPDRPFWPALDTGQQAIWNIIEALGVEQATTRLTSAPLARAE